jgi:hypothetical protein
MITALYVFPMTPWQWIEIRGAELLAALVTCSFLVGGVWVGVPFLRARIGEVFLYSFCCLTATVLHAAWDLAVRCSRWLVVTARPSPARRVIPRVAPTPTG